jgi:uncharacterized membrane protein HdeD (DUF308 family)
MRRDSIWEEKRMSLNTARYSAMSDALAQGWWAVGLRGLFGIAFGLICLALPGVAILSLVLLFAAYMLVDGVFAIVSAVQRWQHGDQWGLLILEGVVDIAAGVIAFLWPGLTALVFVYIVAFWAMLSGFLMLAAAFSLKMDHGRWWLALGGIASVIFGIVLLIVPLVGALVLTFWLGAYAVVFGVLLLILSFKLHSRREEQLTKAAPAPAKAATSTSSRRSAPARRAGSSSRKPAK